MVYNGIDFNNFGVIPGSAASGNPPASSLRTEFGIGTAPLVGVFGRLTAWKGQDVLIRAMPSLPGVHAIFVGDALFKENAYADSLRMLAAQSGVSDRTHFAGFRSDVAAAMSEVDVVAHTSTSPEPFGRVLVEAMLSRKPLVAAADGGAAEIISHGHDGVLIPSGNPALLATAILELLENPSASVVLLNAAYQTAINRFGIDQYLAGCDAVAAEVMQSRSPRPTPVPDDTAQPDGAKSGVPVEAVGS